MKASPPKLLFAAAVFVALVIGLGPKVIGMGIQEFTMDSLVALIPAETQSQFEFRQSEVSSGWFASSGLLEVTYTPLGSDAIALQLHFDITHGPLLRTADGLKFGLAYATITPSIRSDAFDLVIADLPFSLPELSMQMLAGFDQSLRLNMNIATTNYSGTEGELSFGGLEGDVLINADQSAEFNLLVGKIDASAIGSMHIVIDGLEFRSHTEQMNDLLAPSYARLSIPFISSDAPIAFSATEIFIESNIRASNAGNDKIDMQQQFGIDAISSELPLASFSWNSEINELDSKLFTGYYELLSELQSEMSSSPNTLTARLTEIGQELGIIALQNSLVFNNLVRANAYDGNHSIDLQIRWGGMPDIDNIASMDISAALDALAITLEIDLDRTAIDSSPLAGLIDPYINEGYLVSGNGRILLKGSLQNSVLTLNDEVVPLGQFF